MLFYEVSPLKQTHARESVLTYHANEPLQTGSIVTVPVGKQSVVAVVLRKVQQPNFETRAVESLVTNPPLPAPLLALQQWLSSYYASHPVLVWRTMLPAGLTKKRRGSSEATPIARRQHEQIVFTPEQQSAVKTIMRQKTGTTLLHGETGSGKTAVYIELAKQTVRAGQSVIVLVPEIALTSQLVAEFSQHFQDIHVTHSTMTEATRHKVWLSVLEADTPQVIVGPRSALFMPVKSLGLIVVDECHEPAFKQEKSPRYSALRAASVLAQAAKARLVLGSATPNVSDYFLAKESGGTIVRMNQPARKDAIKPKSQLVDMTKRPNFTRSGFLSNQLLRGLTHTLESGHQALIFHNRRGSAPITLCESCGWSAACPRCFIPLTLHVDEFRLRCHICNHTERIPTACPDCQQANIIHKGIGTKRIEEELVKLFPHARIARFDSDNKEGVDTRYQELYDGDIDIIIGTQVVAKGLDLPKLRLVGVIQADSGLSLPDYQSSERVFQLLSQVTGRVGRNQHPSTVVIQSYQPDHPSVSFGIHQNYAGFYTWCLAERKRANFPPYTHLLRLTAVYKTESGAIRASRDLVGKLRKSAPKIIEIIGPAPSFYERVRDTYRWQIVLKSPSRQALVDTLNLLPAKGWQSELDPINLL